MSRIKSAKSSTAQALSGSLDVALCEHASERCRHFFCYLYIYKMITDILNGAPFNLALGPQEGLTITATHQVDVGMRSQNIAHTDFDRSKKLLAAEVRKLMATGFKKIDAAHFCNLGIKAPFSDIIARNADAGNTPIHQALRDLFNALKVFSGDTRQLPQAINLGPDRVIDILHGTLANEMLDGSPPLTAPNFQAYIDRANQSLGAYKADMKNRNRPLLAQCAQWYRNFYNDGNCAGQIWTGLIDNALSECQACNHNQASVIIR